MIERWIRQEETELPEACWKFCDPTRGAKPTCGRRGVGEAGKQHGEGKAAGGTWSGRGNGKGADLGRAWQSDGTCRKGGAGHCEQCAHFTFESKRSVRNLLRSWKPTASRPKVVKVSVLMDVSSRFLVLAKNTMDHGLID